MVFIRDRVRETAQFAVTVNPQNQRFIIPGLECEDFGQSVDGQLELMVDDADRPAQV